MNRIKVKIWIVTTDGDNVPVNSEPFATEDEARQHVIDGLETFGVARCKDGQKLSAASLSELSELWEEAADGCCIIEEHELAVLPTVI